MVTTHRMQSCVTTTFVGMNLPNQRLMQSTDILHRRICSHQQAPNPVSRTFGKRIRRSGFQPSILFGRKTRKRRICHIYQGATKDRKVISSNVFTQGENKIIRADSLYTLFVFGRQVTSDFGTVSRTYYISYNMIQIYLIIRFHEDI